jgi:integrase/recombinase XerD
MTERTTVAVLRDHEVAGLLGEAGESAAGLRMAALIATLYHACPRLGVALGMEVDDVDLPAARIRLRGRRDWEVRLEEGPLARLSRWLACRAAYGLGPGPLFCTFDGTRLDDSYVRRELAALGRRAGVTVPVSAEALRRAGVARLIALGVDDDRLQQRLDHGRAGVTARYRRRLEPASAAHHLGGATGRDMAPWPARSRTDGGGSRST